MQLAAKLVGMVFLACVMPLAFRCLGDPDLAGGRRFTAVTPTSQRMVEIGSGYFLYDIVSAPPRGWRPCTWLVHREICWLGGRAATPCCTVLSALAGAAPAQHHRHHTRCCCNKNRGACAGAMLRRAATAGRRLPARGAGMLLNAPPDPARPASRAAPGCRSCA